MPKIEAVNGEIITKIAAGHPRPPGVSCLTLWKGCVANHANGNGLLFVAVGQTGTTSPPSWPLGIGVIGASLLALGAGGRDLACGHEIANVLLEELVVVIELVVLFADSFDSVEDGEERLLQGFCVSLKFLPRFPSQCLDILARSSRAHGSHIVGAEVLVDWADGAVAGDDEGAAALASREMRAHWCRSMNVEFLMVVLE